MNRSTKRRFGVIAVVAVLVTLTSAVFLQVKPAGASVGYEHVIDVWQRAWNEILQYTPAGQYYEALSLKHSDEVQSLISNDPVHIMMFWQVAEKFVPGLEALLDGKGDTVRITDNQVRALKGAMDWLASVGSDSLRTDIVTELQRFPPEQFVGMTMNEALDYLNANVPAVPTEEPGPTPIATLTEAPAPIPAHQCVAGYYSDCLAGPTLVPGTGDQWAFYVLNGVYFEYPSTWRVEKFRTDILYLVPVSDSPEGAETDVIPFFAGKYPDKPDVAYDPLTYPQTVWLRPVPYWKRLITLPDIIGSEFLWSEYWSRSIMYAEAIFYDPNTKVTIGAVMPMRNDPPNASLRDQEMVQELYPNYRHILESIRLSVPTWAGETTPEPIKTMMAVSTPLPIKPAATIPHSPWDPKCLVGHASLCIVTPSLVPGSDGKWAYYVLNGVYFEYPSDWDVLQEDQNPNLLFQASPESAEGMNTSTLALLVSSMQIDKWDQILADLPPTWRPNMEWRQLIDLPDFQGVESFWKANEAPDMELEFFFYNKDQKIAVDLLAKVNNAQMIERLNSPDAAKEIFPGLHHIIDSLRFWKP
jgi:hypothetical protein